jgi:hypothetical protein
MLFNCNVHVFYKLIFSNKLEFILEKKSFLTNTLTYYGKMKITTLYIS